MRLERLIICAAALTSCTMHAHGQWSLNGNKAFYNAGNVGIGTNNPAFTLEVRTVGPRGSQAQLPVLVGRIHRR